MFLEKIKKILEKEGGKCIIVDENKPYYIAVELKNYDKDIEKINQDIDELKASEEKDFDLPDNDVKIEDLPF